MRYFFFKCALAFAFSSENFLFIVLRKLFFFSRQKLMQLWWKCDQISLWDSSCYIVLCFCKLCDRLVIWRKHMWHYSYRNERCNIRKTLSSKSVDNFRAKLNKTRERSSYLFIDFETWNGLVSGDQCGPSLSCSVLVLNYINSDPLEMRGNFFNLQTSVLK